jgi:hypothetical protein
MIQLAIESREDEMATIEMTVETKLQPKRNSRAGVEPSSDLRTWTVRISRGQGAWINVELIREDGKIAETYGRHTREKRWSYDREPPANVVRAYYAASPFVTEAAGATLPDGARQVYADTAPASWWDTPPASYDRYGNLWEND